MFAKNSVLTIQSLSYLPQYTTYYFHLVENVKSDILVNFFPGFTLCTQLLFYARLF
jgi:hypothetical protein